MNSKSEIQTTSDQNSSDIGCISYKNKVHFYTQNNTINITE